MDKLTILLSGMVAAVPYQGGATWAVLQYLRGLRRLGHDVWFIESLAPSALQPEGRRLADTDNASYFRTVMRETGTEQAALLLTGTQETVGASYAALRDAARRADVLLNIAGTLTAGELFHAVPRRAYLDLDPGFTQAWHMLGVDVRLDGHTHYVTVGQAIGHRECLAPTCGISWLSTLPPVVMADWPPAVAIRWDAFTTVANWRSYGAIEYEGVTYGQKVHSLRQMIDLPTRTEERFTLALSIHSAEVRDLAALTTNEWGIVDPARVVATPTAYQRFVQGSRAEFGIAKSGYVSSRTGWFSERSACYLASGRPVIAQDTGFSRFLPTGSGLFTFRDAAEVLAAVDALRGHYARHARAARAFAEAHFDSATVLPRLLERIGAAP